MRAYAFEQLDAAGERFELGYAHAEWMASLVDHPVEEWHCSGGVEFTRVVVREFDNWREATMFAISRDHFELGVRLAVHPMAGDEPETVRWTESVLALPSAKGRRDRRWLHWTIATGAASTLDIDSCTTHLDAFEQLAVDDNERLWLAPMRGFHAELTALSGLDVLRPALEHIHAPGLRGFALMLAAGFANLPPKHDLALALEAVAHAERHQTYTLPVATAFLALALAPVDPNESLRTLNRASAQAADHPAAFVRSSVAGWGSMALISLPTREATRHLLRQLELLQPTWTNAHDALLAGCLAVLRREARPEIERIAAFLFTHPGVNTTVLTVWPDVDVQTLPSSADDFETILSITRDAFADLASDPA
jgi:hypothetical protein